MAQITQGIQAKRQEEAARLVQQAHNLELDRLNVTLRSVRHGGAYWHYTYQGHAHAEGERYLIGFETGAQVKRVRSCTARA